MRFSSTLSGRHSRRTIAWGRVPGVDISEDLLTFARQRKERGWLTYRQGDAQALDVEDDSFDAAVCVQVLEYVEDVDRALSEIHRVLSPGGRALVIDTDWDAVLWQSAEADRMARVKKAWEEHCADPRLPRTLAPRLRAVGFDILAVTGFPIINTSLDPSTLSHALVGLIVDFIATRGTVPRDDLDGWAAELHALSDEGGAISSASCGPSSSW
jgi:arsenite methyltransferase